MRNGKPGDKSICKWCGKQIYWFVSPGGGARWTHGIDGPSPQTPCNYGKQAEPSEAYNVQQILLKYED